MPRANIAHNPLFLRAVIRAQRQIRKVEFTLAGENVCRIVPLENALGIRVVTPRRVLGNDWSALPNR